MNGSLRLMELSFLFTAIPKLSTTSLECHLVCVCGCCIVLIIIFSVYKAENISRNCWKASTQQCGVFNCATCDRLLKNILLHWFVSFNVHTVGCFLKFTSLLYYRISAAIYRLLLKVISIVCIIVYLFINRLGRYD